MESVMDFLAEYYIWFFVAAGILCFALIGFIIDARKKKKNEFKGESISEVAQVQNTVPTESSEVVGSTVNVGGEATLGTVNNNQSVEATMEINDIPMAPSVPTSENTPIEFYSGPVEMPAAQPAPTPIDNQIVNNSQQAPIIGEPISVDNTVQSQVEQTSQINNNNIQ